MPKFTLITVYAEEDGYVSGEWLQDHVGTLETAIQKAAATEKVNSNNNIAVIDQTLNKGEIVCAKRLDPRRSNYKTAIRASYVEYLLRIMRLMRGVSAEPTGYNRQ